MLGDSYGTGCGANANHNRFAIRAKEHSVPDNVFSLFLGIESEFEFHGRGTSQDCGDAYPSQNTEELWILPRWSYPRDWRRQETHPSYECAVT